MDVSNEEALKSYELVVMELRSVQEHTQELGKLNTFYASFLMMEAICTGLNSLDFHSSCTTVNFII